MYWVKEKACWPFKFNGSISEIQINMATAGKPDLPAVRIKSKAKVNDGLVHFEEDWSIGDKTI
ncbi:hypothetical protein [Arcticibacter tournemirensis]|uniref:hypothetical protein n=1 Tax=Arcticibacter tournemirensis TaxID=699437 RepID=UPI00192A287B|nr:hypothetical protein [Arcticibacter tournemirensis]